uniref:Large ribosomal subunit protein mL44 endonuclease domain-containing protein n=1 Tax=Leptobrachium leishanense TaxID=445787 RepID=A0A8C5QFZ5_9ANUR
MVLLEYTVHPARNAWQSLKATKERFQRSQKPNFDYHAEIMAFSKRLNETFTLDLLKTAFVNSSYLVQEMNRRLELGLDKETAALNLQDNQELYQRGSEFTAMYLRERLQQQFPNLSDVGMTALFDYLTGQEIMCYVAQNLALEDLTLSSECPLSPETLQRTFYAVIGALLQSSGPERTGLFIRVGLSQQYMPYVQDIANVH